MTQKNMNETNHRQNPNRWVKPVAIIAAMVAIGIGSRIGLVDWPNFKPIAALALFAGFYFGQIRAAVIGLVLMMVASDLLIGVYEWQIAISVYASLMVAAVLGYWISKTTDRDAGQWRAVDGLKFGVASLTMSTVFFLLTNFGVWASGFWYEQSVSGLVECYTMAIPFFRFTLMGDLFFTGLIAACYWSSCRLYLPAQATR